MAVARVGVGTEGHTAPPAVLGEAPNRAVRPAGVAATLVPPARAKHRSGKACSWTFSKTALTEHQIRTLASRALIGPEMITRLLTHGDREVAVQTPITHICRNANELRRTGPRRGSEYQADLQKVERAARPPPRGGTRSSFLAATLCWVW